MTTRLDINGGEKYLGFARKQLRYLQGWLEQMGLPSGNRYFALGDAEVRVSSVNGFGAIRINGASVKLMALLPCRLDLFPTSDPVSCASGIDPGQSRWRGYIRASRVVAGDNEVTITYAADLMRLGAVVATHEWSMSYSVDPFDTAQVVPTGVSQITYDVNLSDGGTVETGFAAIVAAEQHDCFTDAFMWRAEAIRSGSYIELGYEPLPTDDYYEESATLTLVIQDGVLVASGAVHYADHSPTFGTSESAEYFAQYPSIDSVPIASAYGKGAWDVDSPAFPLNVAAHGAWEMAAEGVVIMGAGFTIGDAQDQARYFTGEYESVYVIEIRAPDTAIALYGAPTVFAGDSPLSVSAQSSTTWAVSQRTFAHASEMPLPPLFGYWESYTPGWWPGEIAAIVEELGDGGYATALAEYEQAKATAGDWRLETWRANVDALDIAPWIEAVARQGLSAFVNNPDSPSAQTIQFRTLPRRFGSAALLPTVADQTAGAAEAGWRETIAQGLSYTDDLAYLDIILLEYVCTNAYWGTVTTRFANGLTVVVVRVTAIERYRVNSDGTVDLVKTIPPATATVAGVAANIGAFVAAYFMREPTKSRMANAAGEAFRTTAGGASALARVYQAAYGVTA